MQIETNSVVQLHYSLSEVHADDTETPIESTKGGDPIAYLQGHQNMIAGFEQAVEGKQAGDLLDITLTPEQAYGPRLEEAIQRIPVKHLQGAKKWKKGMTAWVNIEEGQRQVTVTKVGRFMAEVDTNHPLAGKSLKFEVEILAVRPATQEELDHGHAHGVGGHQH